MRRFFEQELPQLIDLSFDAALDGRRWQSFIDGVSRCFDEACGVLYCHNRERAIPTDFVATPPIGENFTVSSIQDYLRINPDPPSTYAPDATGSIRLVRGEAAPRGINGDARSRAVPADHLDVPLCTSNGHMVILSVAPHGPARRKGLEPYKQKLEVLAPHFVRAVRLAHLVEETHRPAPPSKLMLDDIRACAFVLDAAKRIVAANRLAEQLLRSERVFNLDRNGALVAAAPAQGEILAAAIASARAGASAPLKLCSAATKRAYLIWLVPLMLPPSRGAERELDHRLRFLSLQESKAQLLLLASDLNEATGLCIESLIDRFGLTRAEARLASALIAGRTLGEFSKDMGVSRNTARNQLAAIFEKTGTRRQAELVAHIIGNLWTSTESAVRGSERVLQILRP